MALLTVLLLFLISSTIVSATPYNIPKLSVLGGTILQEPVAISEDFETFFYDQTLDHFNYRPESYSTFKQKYVMNSKYWGGGDNESAPIFVYFGAEGPFSTATFENIAFLIDNAPHFKALLIYIESLIRNVSLLISIARYYGESIPFGSMEEAMKNDSTRGYFNSAQAIADYAEIILHIKKNLSAQYSPVIVIGGSYGGMLASWFRLKYPHIALGALASSAPILYFDDITPQNGYYATVTKDFKEASESCYKTILESWFEIDKVASQENGLSILSQKFKTCSEMSNSSQLKNYLENMYSGAAQYNQPPVTKICGGIDGAPEEADILGRIFAGVDASRNQSCYNLTVNPTQTSVGWRWQTCSEMVMPIGRDNDTMFPPAPFNLTEFIKRCKGIYGVPPRPHWATTYYGGHDIKLVLQRFASNIIFSNGLRDPYSSAGVLENISDTLLAVSTVNGTHCLDIIHVNGEIPDWLAKQRQMEIEIIEGWITKYYVDLHALKK